MTLAWVVIVPLLTAGLLVLAPARWSRALAWLGVAAQLALALAVVAAFDPAAPGYQLVERRAWMPQLGVAWQLGVDGISVLLPALVALQTGVLVAYGASPFVDRPRAWLAWVMVMAGLVNGLALALDLVLFFVFWELTLVPVHALLAGWGGGPDRRYAAARYTITMLAGGAPLLLGLLTLATAGDGVQTDMVALLARPASAEVQLVAGGLLLAGLAFKLPVVPLHTWLPWTLTEGPAAVGTWMVGLKLGLLGVLRLVLPLTPDVLVRTGPLLGVLGLLGVLHGAFVALEQRGLRRIIAFLSVSHVGLVLLGLSSATVEGLQGAVLQLITFGLSGPLLVLLSAMLIERLGTTDTDALGGLGTMMPRWTALLVLSVLAGIGAPGTSGFVAELLLLVGTFFVHPGLAVLASCGLVVGVASLTVWLAAACGGPVTRPAVAQVEDLSSREVGLVLPLLLVCVLVGLAPGPVLRLSEGAVEGLLGRRSAQGVADDTVAVRGLDRADGADGHGPGGQR